MCGICGILFRDQNRAVESWRIERMKTSIAHRGPDDAGDYFDGNLAFGHRRLSIIDLQPSGHQPMSDATGRFWIIYNGEIYNYVELRSSLAVTGVDFRSHSDTEVILNLFIKHGEKCVDYLNGMFAFAIWDAQERTLFAARDRLGIKPFYYSITPDGFIFASEIKALFASGLVVPKRDESGIKDYLTFQFCLGEKTLFKGVQKLLPGNFLKISADSPPTIAKFWALNFNVDTDHTERYFEKRLLELLEDAVRIQLRADVQVGTHLSGGLDSSSVACLAATMLNEPIHTFSGGFREGKRYNETEYARLVAEKIGSVHHEVFPTLRDFIETLPKIIYCMDEPAAGPGLFPQVMVSRLASEQVKVVLGGQGADELFGGYTRYLIAYLEECIRGGIEGTQEDARYVVTLDSILPNLPQLDGYQPLLKYFWQDVLFDSQEQRYFRLINHGRDMLPYIHPEILNNSDYDPYESYADLFNQHDLKSYVNKMTRFDLLTLLPALLQVEDRTSMLSSLESRVPLLDHRIVELAAQMPPMVKFKGGRSKFILRKVVKNLIPKEVYDRKDKMGFPVPLNDWYGNQEMKDYLHSLFLGEQARTHGLVNVKTLSNSLENERVFGRGLWGIMCLETWMQAFFDEKQWQAI